MNKISFWSFLTIFAVLISGCGAQQQEPTQSVIPSSDTPVPTLTSTASSTATSIPPSKTPTLTPTLTPLPPTLSFTPTPTETPDPFAQLGGCPNGESGKGNVRLVIKNNSGFDIYMRLIGRNTGACYLLRIPAATNGDTAPVIFNVFGDLYQRTTFQCGNINEGSFTIDGDIRLTFTPCSK
jgi:hypothetical protein